MATKEKAEAERLKEQDGDVRRALEQTGGRALKGEEAEREEARRPPRAKRRHKLWVGAYLLALAALGALHYAVRLEYFDFAEAYRPQVLRGVEGALAVVLVLAAAKFVGAFLIDSLSDAVSRYNLHRVLRLVAGAAIALIVVSVLFANWYTAAVSFGVLSLVVGLAVQTPFTSLLGWVYILVRAPYRVGDRIRIGEATGDVIDVGYLDTTLWEVGGQYLSTDHPSGRVIRFPNSDVLSKAVFNYSWPLFPYLWNEVTFQIAYDSDLEFVGRVMREVAEAEIGDAMRERIRAYRELLAETPIDAMQVSEDPSVVFRVSPSTWVEATVRYLVEPREAGPVKTRLVQQMLERLNAEPERVGFPKGNLR